MPEDIQEIAAVRAAFIRRTLYARVFVPGDTPGMTYQPRTPEAGMVTFQGGGRKLTGFLASPRDPLRHPAIIAVHEWWGLNNWIKEQATNLAGNGYVVLAVDLYQGKVTADRAEARKLKRDLPEERAIRDLKVAFDYLAGRPDVDPVRIGSLGWSMGGGLALQFAILEPQLAACVVNYGLLPVEPCNLKKINARVLGIFGSLDRAIPPDKVRAFERCMNASNKIVNIQIYQGAGHAFENPANKRGYRPDAAADAWLRTLAFLDRAGLKSPASLAEMVDASGRWPIARSSRPRSCCPTAYRREK